jgi:hypothetical protein
MSNNIKKFINWTEVKGWKLANRNDSNIVLPAHITERFQSIPEDFKSFLEMIDILIAPDEKVWFLSINDYCGSSDLAFNWNEFEKISLDSADGDNEWKQEIIKFWDRYLPVVMSVRNGYSYYAIDTQSTKNVVVYGYEPEFEEVEEVANSFSEFLELIMKNIIEI